MLQEDKANKDRRRENRSRVNTVNSPTWWNSPPGLARNGHNYRPQNDQSTYCLYTQNTVPHQGRRSQAGIAHNLSSWNLPQDHSRTEDTQRHRIRWCRIPRRIAGRVHRHLSKTQVRIVHSQSGYRLHLIRYRKDGRSKLPVMWKFGQRGMACIYLRPGNRIREGTTRNQLRSHSLEYHMHNHGIRLHHTLS